MPDVSRVRPSLCPACGATIDAAGTLDKTDQPPPVAGDWTVCAYCAAILQFEEGGGLARVTPEAMAALSAEERSHLASVQQWMRSQLFPRRERRPF